MESLSDTKWDVVICGTGLQQSLLALALSRSDKNILHVDPNEYYGGSAAALSLQELETWAATHAESDPHALFSSAAIDKPAGDEALAQGRAYSLTLSPQIVHTRSALVTHLVSSRAYRQIDFLAVGSFFIYKPEQQGRLVRIPSTREDVFSTTAISARAKRGLMKFLKFVLDFDSAPQAETWQPYAEITLAEFLEKTFKLDAELRTYILTLTLSLDSKISTKDGLAVIHRHLTSMGLFGPGFAAVYPKWGGLSEIAQVACRAGAVGGGVYILGSGIKGVKSLADGEGAKIEIELSNDETVRTRMLVRGEEQVYGEGKRISRLVAVVQSPLPSLFEAVVDGAPNPAVAVIALPEGSVADDSEPSKYPIYVMAHSSETGECPSGQSALYFTTLHTPHSKAHLDKALASILDVADGEVPELLYRLYYEQAGGSSPTHDGESAFAFATPSLDLASDDAIFDDVRQACNMVLGSGTDHNFMTFTDRESMGDDDDDEY